MDILTPTLSIHLNTSYCWVYSSHFASHFPFCSLCRFCFLYSLCSFCFLPFENSAPSSILLELLPSPPLLTLGSFFCNKLFGFNCRHLNHRIGKTAVSIRSNSSSQYSQEIRQVRFTVYTILSIKQKNKNHSGNWQ